MECRVREAEPLPEVVDAEGGGYDYPMLLDGSGEGRARWDLQEAEGKRSQDYELCAVGDVKPPDEVYGEAKEVCLDQDTDNLNPEPAVVHLRAVDDQLLPRNCPRALDSDYDHRRYGPCSRKCISHASHNQVVSLAGETFEQGERGGFRKGQCNYVEYRGCIFQLPG